MIFGQDDDTMIIAETMGGDFDSNNSNNNISSIYQSDLGDFQTAKVKILPEEKLDDLVRDLALLKEIEILCSHLSEHRVLDSEAKIAFYCNRDKECVRYIRVETALCFETTSNEAA